MEKNGKDKASSLNKLTLLAVLAHPDDESFGIGGTLALYARRGVSVHLVCATRGEVGTVPPEAMQGYASVAELREAELRCAAGMLGLAGVHFLGYRDSGMPGSSDNLHPRALVAAPLDEVAESITHYIRKLRPQVVITFDPIGGYRHPDHIAIHNATIMAFEAAGDPEMYPDPEGLPPYSANKLYFQTIGRRFLRFLVRIMPIFGRDPRRFGRNGDIDLTEFAIEDFPVHAEIDFSPVADIRAQAAACHVSQDGQAMAKGFQGWLLNHFRKKETFMRAYPPPAPAVVEKDLFANINQQIEKTQA
jgi:LmbE family N-acetylglucosaminyl deacetylase